MGGLNFLPSNSIYILFTISPASCGFQVEGKIVVYNQPWVDYSDTNQYRLQGAARAAEYGAVAALVRSVTQYSIYTPHTGTSVCHNIAWEISEVNLTETIKLY